jgi:hypothetical protein
MNDDDFPNLVRSGTEHSVSVSEHSGNAKTPHNKVTSHEEETEARKHAFEEKALAALEAEKALAAALAEHTPYFAPDDAADSANIQKIDGNTEAKNHQVIHDDQGPSSNVQNISTDGLNANQQLIESTTVSDNIQSLGHEKGVAPNVQNVPADGIAANKQQIEGGKGIQDRRPGVPTDTFSTNHQNIPTESISDNLQRIPTDNQPRHQTVAVSESGNTNHLGMGDDAKSRNNHGSERFGVQHTAPIPTDTLETNHPTIPTDTSTLNRQAISQDAPLGTNRQGIGNEKIQDHLAQVPSGTLARNKVDFPTSSGSQPTTPPTAQPGSSSRAALTPARTQPAPNLAHGQINDAFHGRLAGIKHDVDALNNRLTSFEEKVQAEDAKLDKSKPVNIGIKRR